VRRLLDSVVVIGMAKIVPHFVCLLHHNITIVLGGLRDLFFHLSRDNPSPTTHTSSTELFGRPIKYVLGEMIQSLVFTVFTFMPHRLPGTVFLRITRVAAN
jgi:hypothetical protein